MLFVWFCVFVSAFTGRFVTEQSPPPPPGDYIDVPVNRPDVLEAAQFAVDEFNKGPSIYMFNFTILDITSAKMQVVPEFNYFLKILLRPAMCNTGNAAAIKGNAAANECPFKDLKCTFTVNVIPLDDSRVLLQKECKSTTDSD